MTIKVLIVDDMANVRQDLRTLLDLSGNIEIVGEAVDGQQAIDQVGKLDPDVVLLDLEMPVLDGYKAASQIKTRFPACRIIALTVHDDDTTQQKALKSGADIFIVKGIPIERLIEAISNRKD
jgi:DNA-binding NarL/FixJ family response regulator